MRPACYLLLCSLLLVPPVLSQTDSASSVFYIAHVTVIHTDTGKETRNQTLVISGDRISEVKDSTKVKPAAGAKVVDGTGKYLIPGLWDMHVHRAEYESTYPMYLVNGVTGVREMAGPFDANKFRSDLAAKKLNAPHFFFANPIVDGIPPRVSDQIVVKNAEEARKVVQEEKRAGRTSLKLWIACRETPTSASSTRPNDKVFLWSGTFPLRSVLGKHPPPGRKVLSMSTPYP